MFVIEKCSAYNYKYTMLAQYLVSQVATNSRESRRRDNAAQANKETLHRLTAPQANKERTFNVHKAYASCPKIKFK